MKSILETRNLCKEFHSGTIKQQVIEDLSMSISPGDFAVIMGASGAGKSTLLYLLSGMDRPTSGDVCCDGKPITKLSNDALALFRRYNCGFVFQQSYLNATLSVLDNVLINAYLGKENRKHITQKAKDLLLRMNISQESFSKFPHEISGGEAQRVAMVRAIINSPSILFADEPTGALNSDNTREVLDLLSELNQNGQTIVVVTHDIATALRGNRIFYISDGTIRNELRFEETPEGGNPDKDTKKAALDTFLQEMKW